MKITDHTNGVFEFHEIVMYQRADGALIIDVNAFGSCIAKMSIPEPTTNITSRPATDEEIERMKEMEND